jgi:hypothetical protein
VILWRFCAEGFVLAVHRHNTGFLFLSWHSLFYPGNIFFSPGFRRRKKENLAKIQMEGGPARVPVTTKPPTKTGKTRKGGQKERVYGATRTASRQNLQQASPSRYAVVSPDAAKAFRNAIDSLEFGVDPQTGRPTDPTLIAEAREAAQGLVVDAKSLSDDQTDLGVLTQTVSNAVIVARRLNETDPERAGAILAATQILVNDAGVDDETIPALDAVLNRTFSEMTPGKSTFTPNKRSGGKSSSAARPLSSTARALDFDQSPSEDSGDESDEFDDPRGPYGPAQQGYASAALGAVTGAASNLLFGRQQPAQTTSAQSADDSFHEARTSSMASARHSGSPHLSSVVSGRSNESPPPESPDEGGRPATLEEFEQTRAALRKKVPAANIALARQSPLERAQSAVDDRRPLGAAQAAVNAIPQARAQAAPAAQQNVAPPQNVPMAAIPPPVGAAIAPPITAAIDRQRRDNAQALAGLRDAVNRIGQQQDLTPAQVQTVLTNLEGDPQRNILPAPLTSQLLAQGKLRMQQLLVPADVQSYEKALRDRRVRTVTSGTEQVAYTGRLRAQPILTRYVPDPVVPGAKVYKQPRFAGASY